MTRFVLLNSEPADILKPVWELLVRACMGANHELRKLDRVHPLTIFWSKQRTRAQLHAAIAELLNRPIPIDDAGLDEMYQLMYIQFNSAIVAEREKVDQESYRRVQDGAEVLGNS